MQIAVGGCLAQMERAQIIQRAPWVDVVYGTHNIGALPRLLERARRAAGGAGRDSKRPSPPSRSLLPARRQSAVLGVGVDLGRLQQHLHVLHRPVAARAARRTAAPATSWRRSPRWSATGSSRSPCSGRT